MNKKLLVIVTALVFFSPVAQASYSSYAARATALWLGATLLHMNSKFKKPNSNPERPACDSVKGFLKNAEYYLAPWGDAHQPDLDPKVSDIDPITGQPSKWYPKCQPRGLGLIAAHGKAFDGITKTAAVFAAISGACAVAGLSVSEQFAMLAKMLDITKADATNVKTNFGPKTLDSMTFGLAGLNA